MEFAGPSSLNRDFDASSFNRLSFLPQSYFPFSEGTYTSSWMPNKNPSKTKQPCTFTIESILSLGTCEAATRKIQHFQQPGGGAYHPAMLTWAHLEDFNISLKPIYYPQPNGYNQRNGYNRVMFNDAGQAGILSRGNLRRSCRRIRTIYTEDQLTKLEEMFSKQRYMTGTEKMLLASALRLTETQVKVWFQNRRTRWRKNHEDLLCTTEVKHCAL